MILCFAVLGYIDMYGEIYVIFFRVAHFISSEQMTWFYLNQRNKSVVYLLE